MFGVGKDTRNKLVLTDDPLTAAAVLDKWGVEKTRYKTEMAFCHLDYIN